MSRAIKGLACFAVTLLVAGSASADTQVHRDGGGYTYRSPSGYSTYTYRYESGATYQRAGNIATYSDRSGTYGTMYYGSAGRYDSFQNFSQGWSGSGYTPYAYPQATTYTRTYSRDVNTAPAQLPRSTGVRPAYRR